MTEKLIPEQPAPSPEEQRKRMERVAYFETHDCPAFVQDSPLDAAAVYREFTEQYLEVQQKQPLSLTEDQHKVFQQNDLLWQDEAN